MVGKKVLIVIPRLGMPGGVANYYAVLKPYLQDCAQYFEVGSIPGESGAIALLKRSLSDIRGFSREIRNNNYSLIHVNPSLGYKSLLRDGFMVLLARRLNIPVLVFFRGWNEDMAGLIQRYFKWLFRMVFGKADAIAVLARSFGQQLHEWGVSCPLYYETTVVEESVCAYKPRDATQVRSRSRQHGAHILFLSRLEASKGLFPAIRAYMNLKRRFPEITMTVAGDGERKRAACELVEQEAVTGIEFVGHVTGDEKQELFESADIFFFPTEFGEGMPNAVLEAMAYGLPVVTRRVGGMADFFEHGKMGFITDDTSPEVFAGFLGALIENADLRESIGKFNRIYAREHFCAPVVADRLKSIYERLGR